jgi:hypothetical protein
VLSKEMRPERREKQQVPPPPVDQPEIDAELKSKSLVDEDDTGYHVRASGKSRLRGWSHQMMPQLAAPALSQPLPRSRCWKAWLDRRQTRQVVLETTLAVQTQSGETTHPSTHCCAWSKPGFWAPCHPPWRCPRPEPKSDATRFPAAQPAAEGASGEACCALRVDQRAPRVHAAPA